jgi:hypothetical protein
MGLVSYFKNLHYNNKLKKADKLLEEGSKKKAEEIYISLLDKQPLAAGKLAAYYYSEAIKANVKTDVALFNEAVALEKKSAGVRDAQSYDLALADFAQHLKKRANTSFDKSSYQDCYVLISALNSTHLGTNATKVLCSEIKIHLLFDYINSNKVGSDAFKPLVDAFKDEWDICKDKVRAKKSVLDFCQKLIDSGRFLAANEFLPIVLLNPLDDKCVDNAVQIISGNDAEATPPILKTIVSGYGKNIVLKDSNTIVDSISLFDKCWNCSSDVTFVMDVLNSVKDEVKRNAIVSHVLAEHTLYLRNAQLHALFTKWICNGYKDENSLTILEKIHTLGYDVEKYYTEKVHSLIMSKTCDEKVSYLDHALTLFPKTLLIIKDKLACAQWYLDNNLYDKALMAAESILHKCDRASLVKAYALCNMANSRNAAGVRVELLNQAKAALKSYTEPESEVVESCIKSGLTKAAEQYFVEGDNDKAYSILTTLAKEGEEQAAFIIAKHRICEVNASNDKRAKYDLAVASIKELLDLQVKSIRNNEDYQHLWDERASLIIEQSKSLDDDVAVKVLDDLAKSIDQASLDAAMAKSKKAPVLKEIIKRKYLISRNFELAGKLTEASDLYSEINSLEAKTVPTLSALRFMLCRLKFRDASEILEHKDRIYTLLRNSAGAYSSEKKDIAYRFALTLLKSGEDKEAFSVLSEFLPKEEHLKKACEQGEMLKAQAKLDDFNVKLDAVKDKSLFSDDTVFFINHMLDYAETINPILRLTRPTLAKYRNKLKNYAIFKLFDEGRFDVAFEKIIKEHPDYLDDLTALRNIALVCLNIVEAKQISPSNFREVIAVWLTAIYQERLFVKSLYYTSWDDKYTFSLYDAYGHFDKDTIGDLPDNVNFSDEDNSNVVLIKDVQRALLDRFEAAISHNQHYHDFFTSQKDAMDALIALNLDEKCRLVAPYLAHNNDDVFQDISDALEQDRQQENYNWEDVLSVGALYQMPQSIYSDYSNAKIYFNDCKEAVNTFTATKVRQAFSSEKIEMIKRFDKLDSALKSYCNSKISALSAKNKNDFKNNYGFFLILCNAVKDSTLSFTFSNYVMQYVVEEVNGNSMKKSEAADIILSIFLLDKNNTSVKENLQTLFEMLAKDEDLVSMQAASTILSKLLMFDHGFYMALNKEYEDAKIDKELNAIVAKVNSHSMSECDAIRKVYALYETHPNYERICGDLAQLCNICIMKYIVHRESGSSYVRVILNKIQNNMSLSFQKHRSIFKKSYNDIWNQLPSNVKLIIIDLNPNASLNADGQALKAGLDYYKSFGGVPESSSFADLLNLFEH